MSDSSENKNTEQQDQVEYVPEIDNTNYFKEQDEKFEELHKKLKKLKEENKKQIDAIINSLDDLMASKCVIEQTLDKGLIPDDLPIQLTNEKLNVVELLSKVTGIVNESNNSLSEVNEDKECESKDDSDEQICKEEDKNQSFDKMECSDNTPKDSELSDKKEDSLPVNSEN